MFVHNLVSESASHKPDAIAVKMSGQALTYSELEKLSNRLAHSLINKGVQPGTVVGISMQRSPEMIAGILAILKCGAAYLPLDPAYPQERLNFMLAHSKVRQVLLNKTFEDLFICEAEKIVFEDLSFANVSDCLPEINQSLIELAYVIYTSGSSGNPKGVSLGHKALLNLIDWQNHQTLEKDTITLQFTPISFDVHFQEIFSTLSLGGKLILVTEEDRLDPTRLLALMKNESVNRLFLPYVALNHMSEVGSALGIYPPTLKEVITAGEALKITPVIRKFFKHLNNPILYNHYGPSESHVVTSYTLDRNPEEWPLLPPIGKAIKNCEVLLLDEAMKPVAKGADGELYLKGVCLAHGYLNSPELTAEKFLEHPVHGRIYKTGDSGYLNEEDDLIFLGRKDGQVKIRGYRIETGEIEIKMMALPGVDQAVVTVRSEVHGNTLCAYFKGTVEVNDVRESLKSSLPDYMLPSHIIHLKSIPLTPSGKVDYKNLPSPSRERPDLSSAYSAPTTPMQEDICHLWMKYLSLNSVGIDDSFFDLGGNSLLALKFMVEFNQSHAQKLTILNLFNFSTVRALSSFLEGRTSKTYFTSSSKAPLDPEEHDIAVISMTGRFPGAKNIDEFWSNLVEGKHSLERFSPEEIHPSVPQEIYADENFVPVHAELPGQEHFDYKYFGMTPREAELMDPQQRKFLELSQEALELAGYLPDQYAGSIGVFAGMGNSLYGRLVDQHPDKVKQAGEFNVMLGLEKDYIATRAAFKLNLTGPALSLHTGCSTSLVAIIEAVKSLRQRNCDMALAGGISISGAPKRGHLFQEGGILSKDGLCRPFDSEATGTVFSDGAGIVVLKRLKDAKNDGDNIIAVVKGVGINNDGGGKMSFTAPSIDGQVDVISRAQVDSDIDLRTISYVEAHGTATPVGDPIEVEALGKAFNHFTQDKNFCYLGSVKSNIGHLTCAAGVAGFIKTAMAVKNGVIPGTVNFRNPNPLLDINNTPFIVTSESSHFPLADHPRRAALSSFGVGGTNGHLILEEYKRPDVEPERESARHLLFKLSAKSEKQVQKMQLALIEQLSSAPLSDWPKIAYTLETGRKESEVRSFFIAKDKNDLTNFHPSSTGKNHITRDRSLYFVFPGQGSHYAEMGKGLYESSPVFAAYFDNCCEVLKQYVPYNLKDILFDHSKKELLNNTYYTQPAIFIIEYCLASTLMQMGLKPKGFLGHSIGEYAAATLAGVFTLEDGLKVIAKRAELIKDLPAGIMLSVGAKVDTVKDLLAGLPLDIAAINGPESCVVAGEAELIHNLQKTLSLIDIPSLALKTSHAFHSRMMKPAVAEFKVFLDGITKHQPQIPICSSVTTKWEDSLFTSSEYWSDHIINCVSFSEAARTFTQEKQSFFLEIGPKNTLTNLLRKQWAIEKNQDPKAHQTLGDDMSLEIKSLLKAIGELWVNGIKGQRPELNYQPHERKRVPTVTYAFEEHVVWLSHPKQKLTTNQPNMTEVITMENSKKDALVEKLGEIFERSSGIDVKGYGAEASFMEMGMDSLFLTQIALQLKKEFKVNITFRQLLEEYSSLNLLADTLLDKGVCEVQAPPKAAPVSTQAPVAAQMTALTTEVMTTTQSMTVVPSGTQTALESILNRQLDLMNQQISLLRGSPVSIPEAPKAVETAAPVVTKTRGHDIKKSKEAFGAAARIHVEKTTHLNAEQSKNVHAFFQKYNEKTKKSKEFTQHHRKTHADPRVVTGFKPESKEIIYPVVVQKSLAQKLWDIDGNEYIDMTCGFGSNFFGNGNERIKAAVLKQIEEGIEVGPQHPLVGEVSKLICDLTGNDRAAFCNTGSEAVLGAMRLARTVTGRDKIIVFSGSYHGINDEVIIRGAKSKSFPAAPGINDSAVSNMIVLDYGTDESLEIIRSMAHEVAAVLVEPVQSRRCNFHPVEFLKEVRKITLASQTCLIFDEVITGFRIHTGGAQAHFGIRADLCTYGKIVGGGMPIGVISGKAEYMDALDGGFWQFGDDSTPTVGVTYFAGTFVRHPLALAAAKAALQILKDGGEKQLKNLNQRAQKFADDVNLFCRKINVPFEMNNFGALMKPKWKEDVLGGEYLFALLRYNGVHVYDGFPWFINLAHTETELTQVLTAIKRSLAELQAMGLLPDSKPIHSPKSFDPNSAPVEGAKLGRDEQGNPAWFVERAGEYFMVEG